MLFELPEFEYIDAKSIEEAVALLHKYGEGAAVIGGGTDLLGLLKDRIEGPRRKCPKVLINIKNIPGFNRIVFDEKEGLRIGAAVTLSELEASDVITEKYTILREAAQNVGSTQIRNMGTIAGNICQDPQCMYFRHPHFICYKKGGNQCYAVAGEHRDYYSIFGKGKCVMAHPSDLAPVLVALQARVKAVSHQGERYIPLEDFFAGPNDPRKTTLGRGELINEIVVSVQEDQTYQHFLKHRIRQSFDFALSSVAVVAQISKEICHEIRVVLGGVAPFPYPVHKVGEMMQGERLDAKLIVRAAEASVEEARPLSMNRYKVDVTRALVARALTSAWRKSFSAEGLEISI